VSSPLAWIDEASAALKRANLWRTPRVTNGLPHDPTSGLPSGPATGPIVEVDGERLLLLCSNNYLGLAADPRLAEAAAEAARRHGSGSGASRLVSGTQRLHQALEAALARFKGTEDCVLFSSGYLANLGTIAALVGRGDAVVSDAWNHASIIDGCRLSGAEIAVYPHGDLDACEAALVRVAGRRRRLLCTDSVFSMDGDLAPLPGLIALGRRHGAMLLVDDAHATGVLGAGRGALADLPGGAADNVDALVGTCSKALGSAGGFVAGSRALCDYLRNRARSFVFDTAPPPPATAATLRALSIVEAEPQLGQRVRAHAARLHRGLQALGYRVPPPAAAIVPVIVGDSAQALALSDGLRRRGILAPAIRPPTVPAGTARIRLCPMASHDEAQIDQVIAAFADLRS
jgi:8-amino-7-oxononanoate synthase